MATLFYKEVLDAIARNPQGVGDLIVLRDLCVAVDAARKPLASRLTRDLVKLEGTEDPLHDISYELFHALLVRILLLGWFEEFDLLMRWEQSWFGSKDEQMAGKWEGMVKIVTEEPQSVGLLTRANQEAEWNRALNGLEGAIRHFAKVRLPSPPLMGAPPEPPPFHETVLPMRLREAIEAFFRVLQMLFQQILELSLAQLERDANAAQGLRKLQNLQIALWKVLTAKDKPQDRLDRVMNSTVRITEFRYGRGRAKLHRFLDAFPPHDARSVIFNSLDREDRDEPYIRGEKLGSIQVSRDRQLAFYLATYGHPWDSPGPSSAWHKRRRALIQSKHRGQLRLRDDDDFAAFLVSCFEDRVAELAAPGATISAAQASSDAWHDTVDLWSGFLSHLCSHSRLNLTEGPPNYLTHAFPRNLVGRLLHDCGVYAVRSAYTLLTVLDRINRLHDGAAGTVSARWVRFPLHVGLMIESSSFGLVVQHNEYAYAINNHHLKGYEQLWLANLPDYDSDPSDPAAAALKFHEDLSANGFSSDLDLPVSSTPVLGAGEAVTAQTIWNSYQKKVVPSQMLTRLVGAPNMPQYQFDVRYLELSEQEREWYNQYVLRFWNKDCNDIWNRWKKVLTDPKVNDKPAELEKHRQAYVRALNQAMDVMEDSYLKQILPKKKRLSADLRADKQLLLPGIRIVASERLEADLPVIEKTVEHINEITQPKFKFPADFVPPFARPEEALLEVP